MSTELARSFFARDLSEAEWDALEASLDASPEAATALSEAAAESYARTGLPEPRWSGRRPGGGGLRWIWLAVLLGGGGLMALNVHRTSAHVAMVPVEDGELPVSAAVEEIRLVEPDDAPERAALEEPRREAQAAAEAPRRGSLLGVVLRLKRPAELRVGVLDEAGRLCRGLHSGWVGAGEVRFTWDGMDSKGRPMPPGDYQVRVQGEGLDMSRPLRLRHWGKG